jgi:hypothetical protein
MWDKTQQPRSEDYNHYDDLIQDVDEIAGSDIKISPDYLIMQAALKAQNCLIAPDAAQGHNMYRVMVEHVEALCRAAKIIMDDYDEKIANYKKELDAEKGDDFAKRVKLAHKKLELLLAEVFAHKVSTKPLKA